MRSIKAFAVVGVAAAFALAGCSSGTKDSTESTESAGTTDAAQSAEVIDPELTTIRVGASPSPHAEILTYISQNLAAENGLNLEVVEFTDYITPNTALDAGEIDANFFQTVPYLEDQIAEGNFDFEPGAGVHLEPLGIYSDEYTSITEVPGNAVIGIIQDPTNQGRALKLLADAGFVDLPESGDINVATVTPLNGASFVEVEGPSLVRNLQDVDIAVINGNFALAGGLSPAKDALVLEDPTDNPSVNVLVWRTDSDNLEAVKKLEDLLHSDAVRQYIEENWNDGSVIPAS